MFFVLFVITIVCFVGLLINNWDWWDVLDKMLYSVSALSFIGWVVWFVA